MPKLLKISRDESAVRFRHEVQGETLKLPDPKNPGKTIDHTSMEERTVVAHETPLKSFDEALQELTSVACSILELGVSYQKGIEVRALGISYTKHGTRSAQIFFRKYLDKTETWHPLATPVFQIDEPKSQETSKRQCSAPHAKLVADMIREANKYAAGKRQQTLLDFDGKAKGDSDDDGPSTEPLQFDTEAAPPTGRN